MKIAYEIFTNNKNKVNITNQRLIVSQTQCKTKLNIHNKIK